MSEKVSGKVSELSQYVADTDPIAAIRNDPYPWLTPYIKLALKYIEVPRTYEALEWDLYVVETISYLILGSGLMVIFMFIRGEPVMERSWFRMQPMQPINARVVWAVQECPSLVIAAVVVWKAKWRRIHGPNRVILFLFMLHYFNRSVIYPFFMVDMKIPVKVRTLIYAGGCTFLNGYAIARYETLHGKLYRSWLYSPKFLIGVAIWAIGFFVNIRSDGLLRTLQIPENGNRAMLHLQKISNILGEPIEWWGLALAADFHLPLTCFAAATTVVVVSRAIVAGAGANRKG